MTDWEKEGNNKLVYLYFCGRVLRTGEEENNNETCYYDSLSWGCVFTVFHRKKCSEIYNLSERSMWTIDTTIEIRSGAVIMTLVISMLLEGKPATIFGARIFWRLLHCRCCMIVGIFHWSDQNIRLWGRWISVPYGAACLEWNESECTNHDDARMNNLSPLTNIMLWLSARKFWMNKEPLRNGLLIAFVYND